MTDNDDYEWSAFRDDSGQIYYHNNKTNETSWEPPPNDEPYHPVDEADEEKEDEEKEGEEVASDDIDDKNDNDNDENDNDNDNEAVTAKTVGDWIEYMDDEKGKPYYFNQVTNETVWERPTDFDTVTSIEEEAAVELNNEDGDNDNDNNVASPGGNDSPKSSPIHDDEDHPDDSAADTSGSNWIEHKDDEGRSYFYDEKTEETVWEKPADFKGEEDESKDQTTTTTTVDTAARTLNEEEEEEKTIAMLEDDQIETVNVKEESGKEDIPPVALGGDDDDDENDNDNNDDSKGDAGENCWIEHKDDEGRSYYFNGKTEETVWERPAEFVSKTAAEEEGNEPFEDSNDGSSPVRPQSPIPQPQEEHSDDDHDDHSAPAASGSNWVEYKDEEGQSYFYNEKTQETVWDRPADFDDGDDDDASVDDNDDKMDVETGLSPVRQGSPIDDTAENDENDNTAIKMEKEEESVKEDVIDPAVKRLEEAKEALSQPDAIMETGVLSNLIEVIKSDEGHPQNAIRALSESAHGQTASCGLLSRWLADLTSQTTSSSSTVDATAHDKRFRKSADDVREMTQEIVNRIVKERFTKEAEDSILKLGERPTFLLDMMDSTRWRKLLIDLSATNKESGLLTWCLQAISERGHHREIARRINQSEHFPVFNSMLASELAVIGKISVSACYDHDTSISLNELVSDLRRTCTSTAYTYMYAFEVLRFQIQKANDDSLAMAEKDRLLYARIIRKWERLLEVFLGDMIDPSSISLGSTPLFRKRRLDVACTISDLHQKQRRRLHPGQDDDVEGKLAPIITSSDERNANVESAVLAFLRIYGLGSQIDDLVLDKMLPNALGGSEVNSIGIVLIQYPIAIEALLGYLYKPGKRVGSLELRNKCARLVAYAVLAAEAGSLAEARKIKSNIPESETDEVSLTSMLLEGCQLCEQLENMVSFIVTADATKIEGPAASPGERLCGLAVKCAPVAQGVAMWSREITKGVEFVISASYGTISPNIMSLVRIIYMHHPFTRDDVCGVAFQFLNHANSEVVYQTMNSLKEQSLRLLIYLCMRGEAPSVFDQIMMLMKNVGRSPLDASLIRYFISGLLEIASPPFSIPFIRSFSILLKSPASVDAVKTSYFNEKSRNRLTAIMNYLKIRITGKLDGRRLAKEDTALINSVLTIYHSTDE